MVCPVWSTHRRATTAAAGNVTPVSRGHRPAAWHTTPPIALRSPVGVQFEYAGILPRMETRPSNKFLHMGALWTRFDCTSFSFLHDFCPSLYLCIRAPPDRQGSTRAARERIRRPRNRVILMTL